MQELGYNYRICDIQCALGISQFKKIGAFLRKRAEIARYYNDELAGDPRFKVPKELFGHKSAWHLYPLRILDKKINKRALFSKFRSTNIFPQVHFIPIHIHPYYRKRFGYKVGDFPQAEQFYQEEISLPMYPTLAKKDTRRVADVLKHT